MKIYDGGKILVGLIIFVALFASPFYLNMGKVITKPELKIDTPEIQKLTEKKCVEPKEYMRTEHMRILNNWRDAVVRGGDSAQVAVGGRLYDKSLQRGCMKCHSNKRNFCDQCHNYVAIKPGCWDCHIEPKSPFTLAVTPPHPPTWTAILNQRRGSYEHK